MGPRFPPKIRSSRALLPSEGVRVFIVSCSCWQPTLPESMDGLSLLVRTVYDGFLGRWRCLHLIRCHTATSGASPDRGRCSTARLLMLSSIGQCIFDVLTVTSWELSFERPFINSWARWPEMKMSGIMDFSSLLTLRCSTETPLNL